MGAETDGLPKIDRSTTNVRRPDPEDALRERILTQF
jgi:hypothetical protein